MTKEGLALMSRLILEMQETSEPDIDHDNAFQPRRDRREFEVQIVRQFPAASQHKGVSIHTACKPFPRRLGYILRVEERHGVVARSRQDCVRQRVLRVSLDTCSKLQQQFPRPLPQTDNFRKDRLAVRERPGLVDKECSARVELLKD